MTSSASAPPAAAPQASPTAPAADPAPKATKPSASARELLAIPKGRLDDAKFIAISAKYTTAALKLGARATSDPDALRLALSAILKEADVTVDEYSKYALAVRADPARKQKVADAILQLTEKQSGAKLQSK